VRARIAAALIAVLALSGCASDSLAKDYGNGGANYTDGSGVPVQIPADKRTKAIDFTGTTVDGKTFTASESRGPVTVVNFWYANCAPCRAEAPFLQGLYEKYQTDGVKFIGVNIFDQPAGALSFEKTYKITYPSVMDVDSGAARIAARIVGQLESKSILNTLISDTLAESK